jgi:predicted enzyme related to lactoylglutathione lyase
MKFKMSNYIAIHADDVDAAADYYKNVFGLGLKSEKEGGVNFVDADPFVICVTTGDTKGIAGEFIVEDAKAAEEWLLKNGCKIAVRYEDGKPRYFEDRYGLLFHLWEKK